MKNNRIQQFAAAVALLGMVAWAVPVTAQNAGPGRGQGMGRGGNGPGMGQGMGRGGHGPGMGQGMGRGGNGPGMGQGMGAGRHGWGAGQNSSGCPLMQGQGGGAARALTPAAKQALLDALAGPNGEYQAHALYGAVLAKFGQVQPYVAIQQAESHHIEALSRQLTKYGVAVPANSFTGKVVAPANLETAARAAVFEEEKNVALYDRMLAQVKDYPDLTRVFQHLQSASREAHLPTFRVAAANKGQLTSAQMQGQNSGCCGACRVQPTPTPAPKR